MPVTLADIQQAQEVIRADVRLTPLWHSVVLSSQAGVPVLLKCEQMQRTGSFKIRGATNFVASMSADDRARGLVTASAGNHAQGVALAAASRGIRAVVVIPSTAPLAKANATRGYGATVVVHGESLEAAREHAVAIAAKEGHVYLPPFDDDHVIAGQGTVGLGILEQSSGVAEILVPAGGGGLLAGVAVAVKALAPHVRVVGVQASKMDGIVRSLAAGRPTPALKEHTLADGAAVAAPSQRTLDLIRAHVDSVISVDEEAIARAVLTLIERSKMVVEGAGALAVAALQSGAYQPTGPTVAILSGGNIDVNLVGSIVHHGLVEAGRYRHLSVEVEDSPGSLATVTAVIAEVGGNVLEVEHDREERGTPVGSAILQLLVEVNGPEHYGELLDALRSRGLAATPGPLGDG